MIFVHPLAVLVRIEIIDLQSDVLGLFDPLQVLVDAIRMRLVLVNSSVPVGLQHKHNSNVSLTRFVENKVKSFQHLFVVFARPRHQRVLLEPSRESKRSQNCQAILLCLLEYISHHQPTHGPPITSTFWKLVGIESLENKLIVAQLKLNAINLYKRILGGNFSLGRKQQTCCDQQQRKHRSLRHFEFRTTPPHLCKAKGAPLVAFK
mmetsp:Transcript_6673/g.12200  ORF Transcript_6673/g.12200 Transcript_6673/m.12200 type:complete len:206 (-) Transcript_6673:143-760(-)